MVACRGTPFRVRGGSWDGSSSMGDCRKCQTSTASPAKPGGLPVMLERRIDKFDEIHGLSHSLLRKGRQRMLLPE